MMDLVSKRVWRSLRKVSMAPGMERKGARTGIRLPSLYVSRRCGMLENGATRMRARGEIPVVKG